MNHYESLIYVTKRPTRSRSRNDAEASHTAVPQMNPAVTTATASGRQTTTPIMFRKWWMWTMWTFSISPCHFCLYVYIYIFFLVYIYIVKAGVYKRVPLDGWVDMQSRPSINMCPAQAHLCLVRSQPTILGPRAHGHIVDFVSWVNPRFM